MGEPVALLVGSEEAGLAKGILDAAADKVYVPMMGHSSCLSVGMTLAVVAYRFAYGDYHSDATRTPVSRRNRWNNRS